MIKRLAFILALAWLALLAGSNAPRPSLVDGLSGLTLTRPFAPRLSAGAPYRPCMESAAGATTPPLRCATESDVDLAGLEALSARANRQLAGSVSADALHAVALADLYLGGAGEKRLDSAISSLEAASRLEPGSAAILADLAAALLMRADGNGNPRDAARALETIEMASELDPGSPAVRFNRALALEAWGLSATAAGAWRQYLRVDSASPYAGEAKRRLALLDADTTGVPAPPPPGASRAAVDAWVAAWPQQAREHGWQALLPAWGTAVRTGEDTAAVLLDAAAALGTSLRAQGRDPSLAEAVAAIRRASHDRGATLRLARAHEIYGAGVVAQRELMNDSAAALFATVRATRPRSPALLRWATLFESLNRMLALQKDAARDRLDALGTIDPRREPALAGRAAWVKATLELRDTRPETASAAAENAVALLREAGETELAGGAGYVAGDAEYALGATAVAYRSLRTAVFTLRRFRGSVWRCNALSAAARTASRDGFPRAAQRFQDERIDAARRNGRPVYLAEALLARAEMRAPHDPAGAARDTRAAAPLVDRIANPTAAKLRGDLLFAQALSTAGIHPEQALAGLEAILRDSTSRLTRMRELQVRIARAELLAKQGRSNAAGAELGTAEGIVAAERETVLKATNRVMLLETGRAVFDRLAMLSLAEADTVGALAALERGRLTFAARDPADASSAGDAIAPPAGATAVELAMVGDTLLVWSVGTRGVHLARRTLERERLVSAIRRVNAELERGVPEERSKTSLAWLYDVLLRPLERRLGPADGTLVVVADGDLSDVPFAALWDRTRGRYLVQTYAIRFAPSLYDARRAAPVAPPRGRALLVIDPAFDTTAYRGLGRLPWARVEGDSIARFYPGARVLAGGAATRPGVTGAIPGAEIVHFAGHAVFDAEQPERSELVLAASPRSHGPLTAASLRETRMRGVRLVVLSACETLSSGTARSGGFAGFAGTVLDAGAAGVAGSTWKVDDRLATPLMVDFHRHYRASGNGATALRAAQRAALSSPLRERRNPSAWAAFRYAGN